MLQGFQPNADALPKQVHNDTAKLRGIRLEAAQRPTQQRRGPNKIPTLKMVKGRGGLDEGLKEGLLRLGGTQPDGFPVLVGFEEFAVAVAAQPRGEFAFIPVNRQASYHATFSGRNSANSSS